MGFKIEGTILRKYTEEPGVVDVVIPNGVSDIWLFAFSNCENIRSIVIPDSVTTIRDRAFADCKNLEDITIPNNVTRIEKNPFSGDKALADKNGFLILKDELYGYFGSESLVAIPEGITAIKSGAFFGCKYLQSVDIPESVSSIEDHAFGNCIFLEKANLPNSLVYIGEDAFANCWNIPSITFPDSLVTIEKGAFSNCGKLSSINIPAKVMTIGEKAFSDCANLASIMIPNSVEKIGSNAFYRCNALADVNGLIIVRDVLYGCCKPCENIEIPVGVTKIDSRAFAWDNRIRRIVIPNSVRCIGDSAFELCENLSELIICGDVEHIGKSAFGGCRALADENGLVIVQNTVYSYCGYTEDRITIPEGVVAIDNVAFFERDIHSVLIPSGVESIGTLAFGRCEFLKQIVLPKSRIADLNCHVFSRCKAAVLATDSDSVSFWAYSTKENSDNFTDFVQTGKLRKYDLELINNGPVYKYTMPARLLGMLGRVLEPIDLSESTIQIFMEYLTKNAKKLVPIAEEFRCPEIIKAAYENGIINSKNEKAIRKLLAESKVPRIAALTDYHCN